MTTLDPGGSDQRPTPPSGVLLSRDLFFTARITSTARELGHRVATAGSVEQAGALIEQWKPRAVFVDLAAGDLVAPAALASYRHLAGNVPFIAFGSHVDREALAAAAAAGCDPVLPRSRFTIELPDLIRQHLGDPTTEA